MNWFTVQRRSLQSSLPNQKELALRGKEDVEKMRVAEKHACKYDEDIGVDSCAQCNAGHGAFVQPSEAHECYDVWD
jgi:hypothetical protein